MTGNDTLSPDDQYRIVSLLAEGSRGRVYLADDTQGGRQVAIKFPRQDAFPELAVANDDLNHEGQCLALCAHENVVARIGTKTNAEGRAYLIMELVKGKSLKQLLAEPPMDIISLISNILIPLTVALENMHKVGVVHCDLRPDKILIETVDKKMVPKIIGLGRAKFLPWAGREQALEPMPKADIYSLQYASPEQAMGKRCLPASDVYSLGLILYEALAGKPAVQGENELHVMAQHISGTMQPPSAVKNDPSLKKFDDAVMQAIAKETHMRFVDAVEFRDALKDLMPAPSSGGWLARLFKK